MVSGATVWRYFGYPTALYYGILLTVANVIVVWYHLGVIGRLKCCKSVVHMIGC